MLSLNNEELDGNRRDTAGSAQHLNEARVVTRAERRASGEWVYVIEWNHQTSYVGQFSTGDLRSRAVPRRALTLIVSR